MIPFPSDLYLTDEGVLGLTTLPVGEGANETTVSMLLDAIHTMDGAPLWSNVYLMVDGDIDPDTLEGNVRLVDLDDGLAEIPSIVIWREDLEAIVVAPSWNTLLRQKRRYAAYVTDAVKDPAGRSLRAAPAFAAAADLGATPGSAAEQAAQASLRPLLEALEPSVRERVVGATVFRTQNVSDVAVKMRNIVAASPPSVTVDAVYGPEETGANGLQVIFGDQDPAAIPGTPEGGYRAQPHSHVALVLHGSMELPSFLSAEAGVDGLPTFDQAGTPIVKGYHPAKYTLILPRLQSYASLPVAIFVHGINRTRADMIVQADTAAAKGIALLAIDINYHGDRAPDPVDLSNGVTGAQTPDGFGDEVGLNAAIRFFHLIESGGIPPNSPVAMRENLRQAVIDVASLVSFVVDGNVAPIADALATIQDVPSDLSFRDEVGLLSESFGGMLSTVALAIEPNLRVATITSSAAGFPFPSMIHSPNYSGTFLGAVTNPYQIGDRIILGDPLKGARFEPIVMLNNGVLEPGEASAYAAHVLAGDLHAGPGPNLIMTQSYGDEWVPNEATERLAVAMGLAQVTMSAGEEPAGGLVRYVDLSTQAAPVVGNVGGGARTAGFTVWHPSNHAVIRQTEWTSKFEPEYPPFVQRQPPLPLVSPIARLHRQWSTFFDQYFHGSGPPTIIDPYAE